MFLINYLRELGKEREFISAKIITESCELILEIEKSNLSRFYAQKGTKKILLRSWKGIDINPDSGVVLHQFPIPNEGWEIIEER